VANIIPSHHLAESRKKTLLETFQHGIAFQQLGSEVFHEIIKIVAREFKTKNP
jgi:hypothetical protein